MASAVYEYIKKGVLDIEKNIGVITYLSAFECLASGDAITPERLSQIAGIGVKESLERMTENTIFPETKELIFPDYARYAVNPMPKKAISDFINECVKTRRARFFTICDLVAKGFVKITGDQSVNLTHKGEDAIKAHDKKSKRRN